jgi:hypothetical protein
LEGCFTSFNPALERAALKKERYLNPAPAPATPAVAAAAAPTPAKPVPAPPAGATHPLFAPAGNNPFADKLKQALQSAASKQEN